MDNLLPGAVYTDFVDLGVEAVDFVVVGYKGLLVAAADMGYKVLDLGHLLHHLSLAVECTGDRDTADP
jgi:hypothetical protein